jgi:hypothetical protein
MASKVTRCHRCDRRLRNPNSAGADGWIAVIKQGTIESRYCPDCTTQEERAESVMNEATTELALSGGSYVSRPKFRMATQ